MKTVLVTGANRGIGLEICSQLDKLGSFNVVMGSRNYEKGKLAAGSLSKNVVVKQLDVTNEDSIQSVFDFIQSQYGKLDVLINNAALGSSHTKLENSGFAGIKKVIDTKFVSASKLIRRVMPELRKAGILPAAIGVQDVSLDHVFEIMETNFYGPWRMMQVFLPLLQKSEEGRIINISSGMGQLASLDGDYPAYRLSKSSLNALTIMFSNEYKDKKIKVNAMCPGWVRTDMGGPNAPRSVSEGADTAVWLATEENIPSGKFFKDRRVMDW